LSNGEESANIDADVEIGAFENEIDHCGVRNHHHSELFKLVYVALDLFKAIMVDLERQVQDKFLSITQRVQG
jgi:hypothetical protein